MTLSTIYILKYITTDDTESEIEDCRYFTTYRAVLKEIGHPPKIGSRVKTPFLNEDWIIIERKLGEFKLKYMVKNSIVYLYKKKNILLNILNNF